MNSNYIEIKEINFGFIPDNWGIFSLPEVATIIGGGTPRTNDPSYWGGAIPWLSVVDFNNNLKKVYRTEKMITDKGAENSSANVLSKGSLVISARGTVGALTQLGVDMAFNQSCYGLAAKSVSNDFLYYLVKNSILDIKNQTHGSVFDTITRETLNGIKFPIPKDVTEQQKIAEILSSLDDKIELNRKINDNLEKIASSLFKRWFVDFEFPNKDGKPYRSNGGKMIDSEMGEIPDRWKVGAVSNLISIDSGFSFSSSIFDEDGKYGLVTIKNVQDGSFIRQCSSYIKNLPDKMPEYCKLKNGDILLSLTGNVGRICIVNGENFLLNQRVAALNPYKEFNRAFAYFLFRQKDFQDTLINISRGTAQQNLSPIETKNLEIIVPEEEILKYFGEVANDIFLSLLNNLKETENLSRLRDSLLPRLMSGKIRVK